MVRIGTVLLDLVRRFVSKEVKGVFCNTGNEFPEIVRFARSTPNVTVIHPKQTVKAVLATYGFPLISKEQAHGIRQARTTKAKSCVRYAFTVRIGIKGTFPEDIR